MYSHSHPTRLSPPALLPELCAPDTPGSRPFIEGQLNLRLRTSVVDGPSIAALPTDVALQQAVDSLREALADQGADHLQGEVMQVLVGHPLAASAVLLLEELIHSWPLEGVLICTPTPRHLLVLQLASLEHLRDLDFFLQTAEELYDSSSDSLSRAVYWNDGQRWTPLPVRASQVGPVLQATPELRRAVQRLITLASAPESGRA